MDCGERTAQPWRMSRVVRLPSRPAVAAFDPPARLPRTPFGIGHNGGPPLGGGFVRYAWRKAQAEAWKVTPEGARRRAKLAAACGLTYREYALEILERGRWLTLEKDAARIAEILAARG